LGMLKIPGIADPECVVLVSSGEETGFAPAGLTTPAAERPLARRICGASRKHAPRARTKSKQKPEFV
jgi:hypothetical protein